MAVTEAESPYSWVRLSAELDTGIRSIRHVFDTEGSPLLADVVIEHTVEAAGLVRPKTIHALLELIDDHEVTRDGDLLHYTPVAPIGS